MPDYIKPGAFDPGMASGLYMALMDRLKRAESLSDQEKEDTFRLAAHIGNNPSTTWAPDLETVLHPLKALGLGKPNLPTLPDKPPRFRPDPLVIGQPDKARSVNQLLNYVPDLKNEQTHRILMGPTQPVVDNMLASGLSVTDYPRSNLLGVFHIPTGDISINPGFQYDNSKAGSRGWTYQDPDEFSTTVAHELMHGRGFGEDAAYRLEQMLPKNIKTLLDSITASPETFR